MIEGEAGLRAEPRGPRHAPLLRLAGVGARRFGADKSHYMRDAEAVWSEAISEIKSGRGPSRRAHRHRADKSNHIQFL